VTLPLMKPGLANAFLVGFIESMADFGNPVVVGGQYAVLSTDIFFAIVGAQYDQGRAASLALILTGFALAVFFIQQRCWARPATPRSPARATPACDAAARPRAPAVPRRGLPWLAFTVVVYVFAFIGGFVQTWGRDYTPTLAHFTHRVRPAVGRTRPGVGRHGLELAVHHGQAGGHCRADLRHARACLISWLLARTQFVGQKAFEFSALLAFAIPGTVLGVSYILAFNVPPFELTGTALIIVLCFVFRNLPVGVRAGTASFKQLDKSLDEASTMLRAGTATTLRRVVLPLLKPALVAALVYSFVRSMTTVSRRDLPGHGRERTGHHLHHRPRRQRRLRRGAGLLHGADRADVAGHRADPVPGRRTQARAVGHAGTSMSIEFRQVTKRYGDPSRRWSSRASTWSCPRAR
jgi:iron(III) transport system permease protein